MSVLASACLHWAKDGVGHMGAVRKTVQVEIDAAAGAYLGVTASARGLAWRDRLDAAAAKTAIAISQRHALPELLGRVLASRGIGLDEVPVALDPTVKALICNCVKEPSQR